MKCQVIYTPTNVTKNIRQGIQITRPTSQCTKLMVVNAALDYMQFKPYAS